MHQAPLGEGHEPGDDKYGLRQVARTDAEYYQKLQDQLKAQAEEQQRAELRQRHIALFCTGAVLLLGLVAASAQLTAVSTLRRQFAAADSSRDGLIDGAEFSAGMANALGEEPLDGPEREGLKADFDTNGDETIDEHEFIEGNRRLGQFFARFVQNVAYNWLGLGYISVDTAALTVFAASSALLAACLFGAYQCGRVQAAPGYHVHTRAKGGQTVGLGKRAGMLWPVLVHRHGLPGTAYFIAQHAYHTVKAAPVHEMEEAEPTVTFVVKSTTKSEFAEVVNDERSAETHATNETVDGAEKVEVFRKVQRAFEKLWGARESCNGLAAVQDLGGAAVGAGQQPQPSLLSDAAMAALLKFEADCSSSSAPALAEPAVDAATSLAHFVARAGVRDKFGKKRLGNVETQNEAESFVAFTETLGWIVARDRELLGDRAAQDRVNVTKSSTDSAAQAQGFMYVIDVLASQDTQIRINLFEGGQNESQIHCHRQNFASFLVNGGYFAFYWHVPNRMAENLSALQGATEFELNKVKQDLRMAQTRAAAPCAPALATEGAGIRCVSGPQLRCK
jgi:hypothetical protein